MASAGRPQAGGVARANAHGSASTMCRRVESSDALRANPAANAHHKALSTPLPLVEFVDELAAMCGAAHVAGQALHAHRSRAGRTHRAVLEVGGGSVWPPLRARTGHNGRISLAAPSCCW